MLVPWRVLQSWISLDQIDHAGHPRLRLSCQHRLTWDSHGCRHARNPHGTYSYPVNNPINVLSTGFARFLHHQHVVLGWSGLYVVSFPLSILWHKSKKSSTCRRRPLRSAASRFFQMLATNYPPPQLVEIWSLVSELEHYILHSHNILFHLLQIQNQIKDYFWDYFWEDALTKPPCIVTSSQVAVNWLAPPLAKTSADSCERSSRTFAATDILKMATPSQRLRFIDKFFGSLLAPWHHAATTSVTSTRRLSFFVVFRGKNQEAKTNS